MLHSALPLTCRLEHASGAEEEGQDGCISAAGLELAYKVYHINSKV